MKKTQIFYFDVDGTLLDNTTHTVPQSAIDALYALKSQGYLVALCTGRNLLGIKEAGVDTLFPWDGYVLANGSLVLDHNLSIIHESVFEPDFIHALLKVNDGPLLCEGDHNFITGPPTERMHASFKHFGIPEMYPIETYSNQKVYNMISYDHTSIDEESFEELLGDKVLVEEQLGNLEIIATGSGKENGIKHLNNHLGVDLYTGFGDGDNDVEFIRNASVGIAMGNGCESVKKVADFVTRDVSEDGIAFALKKFGII